MRLLILAALWAACAVVAVAASLDGSRAATHSHYHRATKKKLGKLGAKCKTNSSCRSGLFCGTKKKCALKRAAGSTCKSNTACLNNVCFNNVCLGKSNLPVGAPCSTSASCTSTYCGTGSKCQVKGGEGAACAANEGCVSNLCFNALCLGTSNFPVGAPCSSGSVCASTYCNAGTCQTLGGIGAACSSNAACVSTLCNKTVGKCVVSDVQTLAAATQQVSGGGDYVDPSSGPFANVGAGNIYTLGTVGLGNDASKAFTANQQYVTMTAGVVTPVMVREVLATSLRRRTMSRRATPLGSVFSFEYKIDSFSANGYCTLTPLINDVAFTQDTISLYSGAPSQSSWRKKTYSVAARTDTINSIAVGIVCSTNAQATILLTAVSLKAVQPPPPPPPPTPDPTFIWNVVEGHFDNSGGGSAWKMDGASIYQDDYPYADVGNAFMQPSATDGSVVMWQALAKDANLQQSKYTSVNAQGGADQLYTLQFVYELKMQGNSQTQGASLADRSCSLKPVVGGDVNNTALPSFSWDAANDADRPDTIASATHYTEAQAGVYSLYQTGTPFKIPFDYTNGGVTRNAKVTINFSCGSAMQTGFMRIDDMALLPAGTAYTVPEPSTSVVEPQYGGRGCPSRRRGHYEKRC